MSAADRSADRYALEQIAGGRNYNEWIFSRARPFLGRRVLDVGAGIGTFTQLAATGGADVVAVESDAHFVDRLRRRFADDARVRVVHASAGVLPAEIGEFDSALCFNVLEHIDDDVGALRDVASHLRPDGRLLLLVPAHPSLAGPFDRAIGHVRRYRTNSLHAALEEAGLEPEIVRFVNPIGAIGWALRVRLRRSAQWPAKSFRTFERLVPFVRPLDMLRLPFGLSVWAVARRPARP